MTRTSRLALLCIAVALAASGGGTSGSRTPDIDDVGIRLTDVAHLSEPTALVSRRGDDALYVASKSGRVFALRRGQASLVLNLSAQVTDYQNKGKFNEQGLLDIAFAPDGRYLYVHFTDRIGDHRVRSFRVRSDGTIDARSGRDVLRVFQPGAWHNGGRLVFGPDGFLYIGLGDGGSGHGANGQRLGTLLGKILRIDPRPGEDPPYRIPRGNPFGGVPGARGEILAYGLRNPWRFDFDRATGDAWVADVGENRWEEVDVLPRSRLRGANFGWNTFEGPRPFVRAPADRQRVAKLNRRGRLVTPVYAYAHPEAGCRALIGGTVYRGRRIPGLRGAYLFADLCEGTVHAIALGRDSVAHRKFDVRVTYPTSFGEDASGEVYVLSLKDVVYRIDPE